MPSSTAVQHDISKFLEKWIESLSHFPYRQYPTDSCLLHSRQNLKQTKHLHEINNLKWWQFNHWTLCYIYIYIYIYIYVCVCVWVCACLCILLMYIYIYLLSHIYLYIFTTLFDIYIYIYIYIYNMVLYLIGCQIHSALCHIKAKTS